MGLNLGSKGWYTEIKGWESGGRKRCRIWDCVEENVMHPTPTRTPTTPNPVCVFFSSFRSFPTSHYAIFKHAIASHSML